MYRRKYNRPRSFTIKTQGVFRNYASCIMHYALFCPADLIYIASQRKSLCTYENIIVSRALQSKRKAFSEIMHYALFCLADLIYIASHTLNLNITDIFRFCGALQSKRKAFSEIMHCAFLIMHCSASLFGLYTSTCVVSFWARLYSKNGRQNLPPDTVFGAFAKPSSGFEPSCGSRKKQIITYGDRAWQQ